MYFNLLNISKFYFNYLLFPKNTFFFQRVRAKFVEDHNSTVIDHVHEGLGDTLLNPEGTVPYLGRGIY